jgi:hypothetical protein
MSVDGIDVPETKISVKKLYKTKVMAKWVQTTDMK